MNRLMLVLIVALLSACAAGPVRPMGDLRTQAGFDAVWRRCAPQEAPAIFSVSTSVRGGVRFTGGPDVRTKGVLNDAGSRIQGEKLYRLASSTIDTARHVAMRTGEPSTPSGICIDLTLRRQDGPTVTEVLSEKVASDFDASVGRMIRLPEWVCPESDLLLSSLQSRIYCKGLIISYSFTELASCDFTQRVNIYADGTVHFYIRKFDSKSFAFVYGAQDVDLYSKTDPASIERLRAEVLSYPIDQRFSLRSGDYIAADGTDVNKKALESFKRKLTEVLGISWHQELPAAQDTCNNLPKSYPMGHVRIIFP